MKRIFSLISLLIFITNSSIGQIKFEKIFGGTGSDYAYSVTQTFDKGYIIAGYTTSFGSGISDVYILKTDSLGTAKWQKTFGGINIDKAYSIQQTSDSGFVIAGFTNSFGLSGYDMYVIKTDKNGDSLWTKNYGSTDWDFAFSIKQTSDGGYIIAGGTYGFGSGSEDMYLVKTDVNGDTIWTKTYGGMNEDEAKSVKETSDGGYIVTGSSKSFGDVNGDIFTVKTDINGDTMWTYKYSDSLEDISYDVIESISSDYIIGGKTKTIDNDYERIIIRLTASGSFINKTIYPGINDDGINAIVESVDGHFAMTGYTYSYGFGLGTSDCFLVVESPYSPVVGYAIGGNRNESGYSINLTTDGGYVICGTSNSYSSLDHIFLIKTDSTGTIPSVDIITTAINSVNPTANKFKVFPNPSVDNIFINFSIENNILNAPFLISLTDLLGRVVYTQDIPDNSVENIIKINTSHLINGIYFISISTKLYSQTQKVIIQHSQK